MTSTLCYSMFPEVRSNLLPDFEVRISPTKLQVQSHPLCSLLSCHPKWFAIALPYDIWYRLNSSEHSTMRDESEASASVSTQVRHWTDRLLAHIASRGKVLASVRNPFKSASDLPSPHPATLSIKAIFANSLKAISLLVVS